MRLYIYSEKVKLISNQVGSSYTYFGINSDGSAWFLICTSLISQQYPASSPACPFQRFWMGLLGILDHSRTRVLARCALWLISFARHGY